MVGVVLIIVGIIALITSAVLTNKYVTGTFGEVTPASMRMSEGTGVVPSWVSLINLAGWTTAAIGAVVLVASLM